MLNKGEVLNLMLMWSVLCVIKWTSFGNIAGLCNSSKYSLMKYHLWLIVQVFQPIN